MATMLRITQVGSPIGRTDDQRATVRSLGLRRIRHTVVQPDRPEIRGMLRKVSHLVTFEEISAAEAEAFRAEREAARQPRPVPAGPRAKHVARNAWRVKHVEAKAKAAEKAAVIGTDAGSDDAGDEVVAAAPAVKKSAAKRTAAKKAPAKKAAAKKTAAKKAPAKRTAAKKATKKSEG